MPKLVVLWTDAALWALVLVIAAYAISVRRSPNAIATWRRVFRDGPALAAAVVLAACLALALLDSVHFRALLAPESEAAMEAAYDTRTSSLLDAALASLAESRETTYSRPFAYESFTKESVDVGGRTERVAPRLAFGGAHLRDPATQWGGDVARRVAAGLALGSAATALLAALAALRVARQQRARFGEALLGIWRGETELPWRAALGATLAVCLIAGVTAACAGEYHVLGTDITGNDVEYQALKSIRTAFVIGSLATLATLPLAVGLGLMAGYFQGWVDDAIQYFYTVLASVPNILLIAACVLMVQVFLDQHEELFETGLERGDLKLFLLCVVLGLTGWSGLCRLLRGETLKLRELEYVQAAQAFGVSSARIMARHLFPNVAHLVLITTVLEFSTLILYEVVLSYVGVGVDPSMNSFGGMINLARSELARDPVVWWPIGSAFVFMVSLVFAANVFADGVRDAFDPRARAFRPRVLTRRAVPTAAQGR
ncbi:MAG TPA: ABC transporter permease [Myxococcota bacterium]|jgi:peptide/nickel transport system permease protein